LIVPTSVISSVSSVATHTVSSHLYLCLQCVDAVKTTVKLNLLGENQSELGNEELILDLGRALYKLHFQLLLLIEASNKMVAALTTVAHSNHVLTCSDYLLVLP
jgi:hypothetical protein